MVRRAPELTPICRTHADGFPETPRGSSRKEMPQIWGEFGACGIPSPDDMPPCILRALQRSGWLIIVRIKDVGGKIREFQAGDPPVVPLPLPQPAQKNDEIREEFFP